MKLKSLLMIPLTLCVIGHSLAADEAVSAEKLAEPTAKLLGELKKVCKDWAAEDGIAGAELKKYLLDCVNAELELQGYQGVKKLEE